MPRDGSGVYLLPAGTDDFVANTTIESSKIDSLTADLKSDLNNLTNGTNFWTGQFKAAVGTVAAPGVTFVGDLDTGFYRIGADNIGLSLGGVKAAGFGMTGADLLLKGCPTAGGTADALTVTWGVVPSALASGQRILFKAASANTGAATLNLNSLGAKAIRKISGGTDAALAASDILAGNFYDAVYDSTANSAAGGWILITPNAATAVTRATLGLATTDSPQFAGIELGHATDTSLSRSAAGVMAVEGNVVPSPASQATGDVLYRGASSWSRLAIGTASQVLTVNAGATAPEWAAAASSGQPIPTNSTYAIGTFAYLHYDNGGPGTLADGDTVAGTKLFTFSTTTGMAFTKNAARSGTWKNVHGASVATLINALFVRTA